MDAKTILAVGGAVVIVMGVLALALAIGWAMGYNAGQDDMCAQMSNPWAWAECR